MGSVGEFVDTVCRARGAALLGIVNATPDSFYDGGQSLDAVDATRHVDALIASGADIIDIGGESTRPGAEQVPADEQLRRIEAPVRHAVERGAFVSVDTTLPEVAAAVLGWGAHIINDTSCLAQPDLAEVVAEHDAVLILMHSRGAMSAMPGFSRYPDSGYGDVVLDVLDEWREARDRAVELGVSASQIWFDPGIGFHKSGSQSLELLTRLAEFQCENVPIVVGTSRKSFIADVDASTADERLGGSIASSLVAVQRGARVLRVHDVHDVRQALAIARAIGALPASDQLPVPSARSSCAPISGAHHA